MSSTRPGGERFARGACIARAARLSWCAALVACAGPPPAAPARSMECPGATGGAAETTTAPYPRVVDHEWMSVTEWCARVARLRALPGRESARLVFVGDSIMQGWQERADDVFHAAFDRYAPLSLGIGGDQTQNVLWRFERGELDGLAPKAVVLLIGVNDFGLGMRGPRETADGVRAVRAALRARLPGATIVQLAIFPAGERADDPFRRSIVQANAMIRAEVEPGVVFLDLGGAFVDAEGTIPRSIMGDSLHPTREGYERWAAALGPELAQVFSSTR